MIRASGPALVHVTLRELPFLSSPLDLVPACTLCAPWKSQHSTPDSLPTEEFAESGLTSGSHWQGADHSCLAPKGLTLAYVILEVLFFWVSPQALGIQPAGWQGWQSLQHSTDIYQVINKPVSESRPASHLLQHSVWRLSSSLLSCPQWWPRQPWASRESTDWAILWKSETLLIALKVSGL